MHRARAGLLTCLAVALLAAPAAAAPTTTVQRTIQDCDGDNLLEHAAGEDHVLFGSPFDDEGCEKQEGGEELGLRPDDSVINFIQLSDFQMVDEESPARVEFLDGTQRFPGLQPFSAAYRPQESLTTQVTEAMVRQVRNARSPVTAAAPDLSILTGDNADSQQYNETRWFIDILDGTTGPENPDPEMETPARAPAATARSTRTPASRARIRSWPDAPATRRRGRSTTGSATTARPEFRTTAITSPTRRRRRATTVTATRPTPLATRPRPGARSPCVTSRSCSRAPTSPSRRSGSTCRGTRRSATTTRWSRATARRPTSARSAPRASSPSPPSHGLATGCAKVMQPAPAAAAELARLTALAEAAGTPAEKDAAIGTALEYANGLLEDPGAGDRRDRASGPAPLLRRQGRQRGGHPAAVPPRAVPDRQLDQAALPDERHAGRPRPRADETRRLRQVRRRARRLRAGVGGPGPAGPRAAARGGGEPRRLLLLRAQARPALRRARHDHRRVRQPLLLRGLRGRHPVHVAAAADRPGR